MTPACLLLQIANPQILSLKSLRLLCCISPLPLMPHVTLHEMLRQEQTSKPCSAFSHASAQTQVQGALAACSHQRQTGSKSAETGPWGPRAGSSPGARACRGLSRIRRAMGGSLVLIGPCVELPRKIQVLGLLYVVTMAHIPPKHCSNHDIGN